jgi:hypothetical protein
MLQLFEFERFGEGGNWNEFFKRPPTGEAYDRVLCFGGQMSTSLGRLIRIILALSLGAATLTAISHPARAVEGRAFAAGVAGGVADTLAGEALSGALPPPGYNAPAYPPPPGTALLESAATGTGRLLLSHRAG